MGKIIKMEHYQLKLIPGMNMLQYGNTKIGFMVTKVWIPLVCKKLNNTRGVIKGSLWTPPRVVPDPDGTIYLVDMNGTHYWGSN